MVGKVKKTILIYDEIWYAVNQNPKNQNHNQNNNWTFLDMFYQSRFLGILRHFRVFKNNMSHFKTFLFINEELWNFKHYGYFWYILGPFLVILTYHRIFLNSNPFLRHFKFQESFGDFFVTFKESFIFGHFSSFQVINGLSWTFLFISRNFLTL